MATMASAMQDGGCPLGTCLLCFSWPGCDLPWQDLSIKCLFTPKGVFYLEVGQKGLPSHQNHPLG